jgi:hypothetical protein
MKRNPTYRDFLLIAGIVVAMVIAFTTWVYSERSSAASGKQEKQKTSLNTSSFLNKLLKRTELPLFKKL